MISAQSLGLEAQAFLLDDMEKGLVTASKAPTPLAAKSSRSLRWLEAHRHHGRHVSEAVDAGAFQAF